MQKRSIKWMYVCIWLLMLLCVSGVVMFFSRLSKESDARTVDTVQVQYDDVYPPIPIASFASELPKVSLESIFDGVDQSLHLSSDQKIELLVTGDVLLARSINNRIVLNNDPTWPFHKTAQVLKSSDITYVNLETPLIMNCPRKIDGMIFCGDPMNVIGLDFAGVDVVNLANNHAGNQGQAGLDETVELLRAYGFQVSGVEGLVSKLVKGTSFGFLGFNDVDRQVGVAHADNITVMQQIQQARSKVDVLIVQFHFGEEYRYQPTWRQVELAHLAVDQGADLVVSNHPHWFQPVEIYKGKVIMYSHGNFIFDQMWSRETREGVVGRYVFDGKDLIEVEFLPILIEEYGQPRWLEGSDRQKVLDRLKNESKKLLLKPSIQINLTT